MWLYILSIEITFNLKAKPYQLLPIGAAALSLLLVLLKIAGVQFENSSIIPVTFIILILPIMLVFIWLLYLTTKRFLHSRILTWIHVTITLVTAFIIVIVLYIGIDPINPTARRYYDYDAMDTGKVMAKTVQIVLIILLCGQCTFITNLLLGIFIPAKRQIKRQ